MMAVPQARDVFADTSLGAVKWTVFFVVLFLFWAVPVHYAARRALAWDHWAIARDQTEPLTDSERQRLQELYETPARWVPRILGICCFVAVLRGLGAAADNLEQAQALHEADAALVQIGWLKVWTWLSLALFVLFVLRRRAWFVHLGIKGVSGATDYRPASAGVVNQPYALVDGDLLWFRYLLNREKCGARRKEAAADFILDLVIIGIIFVLSVALLVAFFSPFWLVTWLPRAIFLVLMLGAWVLGLTYVTAWSHRVRAPLVIFGALGATALTAMSTRVHDVRNLAPPLQNVVGRQMRLNEAIPAWRAANGIAPDTDCSEKASPCPRPIIVAGQGGASRAAFFTASVIGELLDRTATSRGGLPDFGRQLFAISSVSGSSLGAVVVRAAIEDAMRLPPWDGKIPVDLASAASERDRRLAQGPCATSDNSWFAHDPDRAEAPTKWRDCFQAILSGDFLSPVFVGLAFRDHISYTRPRATEPVWPNRATLLEQAWERRYAAIVGTGKRDQPKSAFQPILKSYFDPSWRLAKRFGYIAETLDGLPASHAWMPLLFINGSSVTSGRRILTSDVKPWYCVLSKAPEDKVPTRRPFLLASEAFDFFELRAGVSGPPPAISVIEACEDDAPITARAPDLALSTAATLSARFPIISPHGAIRNMSGDVVDHVVDGGYFENDGLLTARDIAVALRKANLRPIIIRITNDPVPTPAPVRVDASGKPAEIRRLPPPLTNGGGFLPTLIAPLAGLYNTRAGHGAEAARATYELSEDDYSVIEIKVFDQVPDTAIERRACTPIAARFNYPAVLRELSMSWWLSQPVQEYLDAQLCHPDNRANLNLIQRLVRRPAPAPNGTTEAAQAPPVGASVSTAAAEDVAAQADLTPRQRP